MFEFINSIVIDSEIKRVYTIVCDVEKWPQFTPGCLNVVVIERNENTIKTETTSKVNGLTTKQQTIREFIDNKAMIFKHIKMPFPLKKNEGEWTFEEYLEGTTVTLIHRIETKLPLIDSFVSRLIAKLFIQKETKIALEAIKSRAESKDDTY